MRIGCLQFAPQVGDINNNLNRADAVLNKSANLEDLDLLVLPELAFTGYNFRSLAQITPFLEPSGSGISALWARTTALKHNCNVVVGYPEKVDVAQKWPTSPEFYNSAILVSREGNTIANYRKSFLYAVDETWALEGQDGFFEGHVSDLGNLAIGICMDINPYKFEAPWHAFEFAFHVLEVKADLVIVTSAWLTRETHRSFTQLPHEPDMETLEYWIQRLEPIIRKESDNEIIVVFCNRSGVEDDSVYAGTSTVLGIKAGEVRLYGILGRGVKDLLVVDTGRDPIGRLLLDSPSEQHPIDSNNEQRIPPPPIHPHAHSPTNSLPHVTTTQHPSNKSNRIPTPIEPKGSYWSVVSDSVSDVSTSSSRASHVGPTSSKPTPPKLGLQIPQTAAVPVTAGTPYSASGESVVAGTNIPTPTAPSPTPLSLRPKFPHFDQCVPVTSSGAVPTSVNRKGGSSIVMVSRADTPVTPPLRNGAKEPTPHPTPISEAPPSPPSDEALRVTACVAKQQYRSTKRSSVATSTAQFQKKPATTKEDTQNVTNHPGTISSETRQEVKQLINGHPLPSHTVPQRPPSTKSRNASCTRLEHKPNNIDIGRSASLSRMSIPIVASPSVFSGQSASNRNIDGGIETGFPTPPRSRQPSAPVQNHISKQSTATGSNSPPIWDLQDGISQEISQGASSRLHSGITRVAGNDAIERPASRGRQLFSRKNGVNSSAATQSVSRGRSARVSTVRSTSAMERTPSATPSTSWLFGTPPLNASTQKPIDPDDEIVAMISLVNHGCPVHNHTTEHNHETLSSQQHGPGTPDPQGSTTAQYTSPLNTSERPTELARESHNVYEVLLPPHIRELVESLSNPGPTQSPVKSLEAGKGRDTPKFNPRTPTAMKFNNVLTGAADDESAHQDGG